MRRGIASSCKAFFLALELGMGGLMIITFVYGAGAF